MGEMGIFETMYSARAIRRFKSDPVPDAIVSKNTRRCDSRSLGRQCTRLVVGAILLLIASLPVAAARPPFSQSTGELHPGMLMNAGGYAIAVAPVRMVDGRRVVTVSAPEQEWIIKFGPFINAGDCNESLSPYSRGLLSDKEYEAFKEAGQNAPAEVEAKVLEDVQARCIVSDGSERFRTPGRIEPDPTTDFIR